MTEATARDYRGYGHYQGGVASRVSREIVAAWADYVAGELQDFYARTGERGGVTLWKDTPKASRAYARLSAGMPGGYACTPEELAAFSGAWHTIANHVTGEFKQWVEEERATERLTLTQFAERYRAESRRAAWQDSAEAALQELELLAARIASRDNLIREASMKGAPVTEIARAIGMSRQAVHGVINRVIEADERERLEVAAAFVADAEARAYDVDPWAVDAAGEDIPW